MTRSLVLALCAAILLAAVGLWAQSWLAGTPQLPPVVQAQTLPTPTAPPLPTTTATVSEVAGDAQRFEPATQAWQSLQIGTSLEESALVRTLSGTMTVTIGKATELEVSPDSRFRLDEMDEGSARITLEEGRLSARVEEGKDTNLAVAVAGSKTTATTAGGKFSVLRGDKADVTVAGQGGSVTVAGPENALVVKAGEQTTTAVGQSPAKVIKIPSSLFVKLNLAGSQKLRTRHTIVRGTTTPGSTVSVNGVRATAVNGRFSVNIPLTEGGNSLKIVARDVLGRVEAKEISGPIVDSTPPKIQGSVQW